VEAQRPRALPSALAVVQLLGAAVQLLGAAQLAGQVVGVLVPWAWDLQA